MTVSANMGDSASAQLFDADSLKLSASVVASGTAIPTDGKFAVVGGKAVYKFYAPAVNGTLTATGKTSGAVDITEAVTVTKTLPITSAAATAAEAAEAAANDATDAAITAGEAAEAASALAQEAVDAVAELSASVTKLISALKAQITTLTNLVIKIQKKVKA
jgi:hypothetical protein